MSDTLKKDHNQAHFQQTVIKLRESLEKSIISKEKAVEKAVNDDQLIIRDLEKTIKALHRKIEKERIGEDERIQKAVSDANVEIRHLQGNVQSLRDEMEKHKIGEENRTQKALLMPILKSNTWKATFNPYAMK